MFAVLYVRTFTPRRFFIFVESADRLFVIVDGNAFWQVWMAISFGISSVPPTCFGVIVKRSARIILRLPSWDCVISNCANSGPKNSKTSSRSLKFPPLIRYVGEKATLFSKVSKGFPGEFSETRLLEIPLLLPFYFPFFLLFFFFFLFFVLVWKRHRRIRIGLKQSRGNPRVAAVVERRYGQTWRKQASSSQRPLPLRGYTNNASRSFQSVVLWVDLNLFRAVSCNVADYPDNLFEKKERRRKGKMFVS